MTPAAAKRPHVVVVGGGFGGLAAVRELRRAPVDVTLFDRRNHHVFQPLLYQVATAGLSPANITAPLRAIVSRQRNCTVYLAEVASIDLERRRVQLVDRDDPVEYDHIIIAAGARTTYFGNDQWAHDAPGLKSVEDAIEIRRRVLLRFEQAELAADDAERARLLTFAIVGAGPTGVELAGAFREIAAQVLKGAYRRFDPASARIVLIDGESRVLTSFSEDLSARARRDLESLGVELRLNRFVREVDGDLLTLEPADGSDDEAETIRAGVIVWAAGVSGAAVGATLDCERDNQGRVIVEPDLSIPGHPEAFVVGDLAAAKIEPDSDELVPGVAQGALQGGAHAASIIRREVAGESDARRPFRYRDKGNLATIGRNRAVAEINHVEFGGRLAWLLWAVVHILFLIGHRNKILTLFEWIWMYVTFNRGARLITNAQSAADREST